MRLARTALIVLAFGAGVLANPQNPPSNPQNLQNPQNPMNPQNPIFRSGVEMVRVDVYPRRRDRIVEGLTREDFQLTEDGVRQTIETFEYISIDMDRSLEPLDPRSSSEARRMAADPRNRVFVFYLDTYQIDMVGAYRAREPLLEFLQRSMGPRDLFAWMTPRQSPEDLEFTRMTQDLATLMTVTRSWGKMDAPPEDPVEMKLQACAPPPKNAPPGAPNGLVQRKRTLEVMSDLRELIVRLGALRAERKNLVILGERWQNRTDPFGFEAAPPAGASGSAVFLDQRGPGSFKPPVSETAAFCRSAGSIPTVVFDRTHTMVDLARRNNVALYFVSLAPKNLFNSSIARMFAEETDGQSFVGNAVSQSLQQILNHQTGFYMLGYRSTAGEAGKKARTVRVKTTKSGVDLDVRRIYEPPPPEFVAARNSPLPPVERTDVQKAIDRLPPQRDDLELVIHAVPRKDAVDVSVEIVSRLAASDPWRSGGRVTVTLRDEAGGAVATAESGVAAGDRSARLTLPVGNGRKVSRATAQAIHSTGLTLSDSVSVDPAISAVIGAPVFSRAGSLPRLPFQPAALRTFSRTERLRVEWPLAGELLDPVVRLLNAAGQALPTDAAVVIVDGMLRADLRLLSMAPGEYVIEAAGKIDGAAARHLSAIRITR